jgi:hypothetical protein
MRTLGYVMSVVAIVIAATTNAVAGAVVTVPEISPGSLSAGLALLAGGVLLARARWRR